MDQNSFQKRKMASQLHLHQMGSQFNLYQGESSPEPSEYPQPNASTPMLEVQDRLPPNVPGATPPERTSVETVRNFFLKSIHTPQANPTPKRKVSQKVRRLRYGESLTSDECMERVEKEEDEKKQKKEAKAKRKADRDAKKKAKEKKTPKAKKPKRTIPSDSESNDEQEKCELCGKLDDGSNSGDFIGCDLCDHWYCIDPCSEVDLDMTEYQSIEEIPFTCKECQHDLQ